MHISKLFSDLQLFISNGHLPSAIRLRCIQFSCLHLYSIRLSSTLNTKNSKFSKISGQHLLIYEKKIRILQPKRNLGWRNKVWMRVEPLLHFEGDPEGWSQQMWMCWEQTGVCSCCERQCPASRLFCSVAHFVCPFLRGTRLSNQSPSPETEWAIMFQSDFQSAMQTVERKGEEHRNDLTQRELRTFQFC